MKSIGILLIVFLSTFSTFGAGNSQQELPVFFVSDSLDATTFPLSKKAIIRKKTIAIVLAITLGPFGIHRLYYGTDKRVPIFYSITLGAFGILPLADIIAILISRDITPYLNNKSMVMWMKRKGKD